MHMPIRAPIKLHRLFTALARMFASLPQKFKLLLQHLRFLNLALFIQPNVPLLSQLAPLENHDYFMRVDQYLQFSELGINLPNNQYSNRQAHGPEGIASKATERQIPQTCILCTITSISLRLVLVIQINNTTHTQYLPSITCNFNASSAVVKSHKNNLTINSTTKQLFLSFI